MLLEWFILSQSYNFEIILFSSEKLLDLTRIQATMAVAKTPNAWLMNDD